MRQRGREGRGGDKDGGALLPAHLILGPWSAARDGAAAAAPGAPVGRPHVLAELEQLGSGALVGKAATASEGAAPLQPLPQACHIQLRTTRPQHVRGSKNKTGGGTSLPGVAGQRHKPSRQANLLLEKKDFTVHGPCDRHSAAQPQNEQWLLSFPPSGSATISSAIAAVKPCEAALVFNATSSSRSPMPTTMGALPPIVCLLHGVGRVESQQSLCGANVASWDNQNFCNFPPRNV